MSIRVDTASLIPSAIVCGNRGLGVLGSLIPSTGDNGASFLYNDLSLPADNAKEICGRVTTWPVSGSLYAYEDGSFEFSGAADGMYSFAYQLYVDGVATGSPVSNSLQVGAAHAAFAVTADDAAFSGNAHPVVVANVSTTLGDAIFAGGAAVAGSPASCALIAVTDDANFAGNASVAGVPALCAFSATTASATFVGAAAVAIPAQSSFTATTADLSFSGAVIGDISGVVAEQVFLFSKIAQRVCVISSPTLAVHLVSR